MFRFFPADKHFMQRGTGSCVGASLSTKKREAGALLKTKVG